MGEVNRLYRERRSIVAKAELEKVLAFKRNDPTKSMQIAADCYLACQRIDNQISHILDNDMRQEAQELDIAFPPVEDREMWAQDYDQSLILTFRGRSYLRERMDKEKQRRFDVKTMWLIKFWFPLLGALIGIIGSLTGLVAVIRHVK